MAKKYPTLKNFAPLFFLLFAVTAFSQTQIFTTSGTVSVPVGVTQVTVEVWGAGGGGGSSWVNKYSAGGGGGGAYTIAVVDNLTPDSSINYIVGSGGPGGGDPQKGVDGGVSNFLSVKANGGKGGGGVITTNVASGGLGGLAETSPLGIISYSGGAGSSGSNNSNASGGGGGSSAGTGSIGNSASGSNGAIAPVGGGNGGYGNPSASFPYSGSVSGGGGAGAPDAIGKAWAYYGGNGGDGQIRITWSSLNFIGTTNNDYVDFGDNHSLTSNFSLEAWVLQKAIVTSGTIISKGNASSTKRGYNLSLKNGYPNLTWYDNSGAEKLNIQSPTAIPIDKWYHIAATFDNTTNIAILYVDGVEVIRGTPSAPPTTGAEKFILGAMYDSGTPPIPKNNFDGYIDEVRVWDVALSQQQIREMMNQRLIQNGTVVRGKTIPLDITGGLLWDNLKGYYPLNDGPTIRDKSNNGKHGLIKNMITIQPNTAPLPYTTIRDGSWDDITATTPWTYGNTVWNIPNRAGINGSAVDGNIVQTAHNITSGSRNITVLGLISTAGTLTIANPTVTTPIENNSGQSLRVTHYLELDGAIDLVGESQLLQDQGSILDQDSGGFIERDQQGTANSYNYNYWSSSVGPISTLINAKTSRGTGIASANASYYLGLNGKTEGLMDGTSSGSPVSINFQPSHKAADSGPSSPRTISTYWLYTFYGADDNYWAWKSVKSTTPILAGEGYTMKGTSGAVAIATMQNYVFKGKPNNGNITLDLIRIAPTTANPLGDVDRLIGNPYPSALDANLFIKDNIKTTETIGGTSGSNTNENVFNGALYFWHHFGQENSHYLAAYVGGYATYTLMGGVQAYSTDYRINHSTPLVGGGKIPERYIPVNQGFFVITALDSKLAGKTTTTVDGGTITFKNSQRYFKREGSSGSLNTGSVFMKNSYSKPAQSAGGKEIEETNAEEIDSRPKIRLLFHSPNGYNRQLLIGTDENTTNNFDIGYDGLIADTGSEDMFWMIQDAKFVIQGVPNFNTDQEFPLGIKIAKSGLATIKIDAIENLDEDISAHIKDKLTGETHNISKKSFEINLELGTYLDRFALTFKTQKLVAEDVKAEILIPATSQPIIEGIHVFMNNAIGELQIKNNSTEEILSVVLINSLGQTVKSWNSNFNIRTISLPINTATGVYLVQIITKTGKTVKKISVE